MSSYWESAAGRSDGQHTAEEFEAAAYRLVTEQVLYHSDKHSRIAYYLIERYTKEFERVLEPLGIEVNVNSLLRYVYAKPKHEKSGTASVALTLIALVLRTLYDESARLGQMNDNGEVLCELIELDEKYRLSIGRELPSKVEFDAVIRQLRRCGIVRVADEQSIEEFDADSDTQLYLLIRPAIIEVLGDNTLQRLGHWAQTKSLLDADDNEEQLDDEAANEIS
jgi:hypothetical protein